MRLPILVAVATLASVTLACAIFSPHVSNTEVEIARLPPLTRTPLPTLSPTPLASSQTGAPAEAATVSAISPPVSDASSTVAPGSEAASNAPAASTESAVSAPANNAPANQPGLTSVPAEAPVSEASALNSTPVAGSTPAPAAATSTTPPTPTPTATVLPTATETPVPAPTATPGTAGWSFANVRLSPNQAEGNLLLYGDMVNDTGAAQDIDFLTGTFFDGQGQIIAAEDNTFDYWPVEIVPPSGRVPFELIVDGIQNTADFNLRVQSEASSATPRQDFNFSNVEQWSEEDTYCLSGELQNPGAELQDHIAVVAILYDDQNHVINFGDFYESEPAGIAGDSTLPFEICVDPPNPGTTRHELRAWGY